MGHGSGYVPDLVLSDVMMPEMTGIELCEQIKNSDFSSHIPVVMLTAKSSIQSRIEGLSAGADDYIPKPFSETELTVRIQNLIELRKALREKYESNLRSIKKADHKNAIPKKDLAFIEKAEAVIEENLDNGAFDVTEFCKAMNISRAQAHRKVKAITNLSVSNYIRSYRLKRAVEIMQAESLIVKEVAYRVGFNSPNYFTKCFHEQFGFPPTRIAS